MYKIDLTTGASDYSFLSEANLMSAVRRKAEE